jgi:hypothetical protein
MPVYRLCKKLKAEFERENGMLRATRVLFSETVWNPLSVAAFPVFVFDQSGNPRLTPAELSIYAVAYMDCENPRSNCQFTRSLTELQKLTGFSYRKTIIEALQGLVNKKFLKTVGERAPGSHTKQTYELLNPMTEDGLSIESTDKRHFQSLRSVLRHAGLGYFNVPQDVLRQIHQKPSQALALFVAADRCVSVARERDIQIRSAELRAMSGQDQKTFKKAIEEINEKWLLIGFTDDTSRVTFISLIDPESGKVLDEFEWEQQAADQEAREQRYANAIAKREHNPDEILAWAMWALRDNSPKRGTGSNYLFTCPECRNKKSHKKKFAVDPYKGFYGAYVCFDCRTGGSLNKLLAVRCGLFDSLTKLRAIGREHPELLARAKELTDGRNADGEYYGDGAGIHARVA